MIEPYAGKTFGLYPMAARTRTWFLVSAALLWLASVVLCFVQLALHGGLWSYVFAFVVMLAIAFSIAPHVSTYLRLFVAMSLITLGGVIAYNFNMILLFMLLAPLYL